MKYFLLFISCFFCRTLFSQNLQLHYDFRHSFAPKHNTKNFPTLYFEYFKSKDSGSFLLKIQSDFIGEKNNIGQLFMQVSQTFRFWKPKIFLQLQYSGGLGISEPSKYGYYISNAFLLGAAYPFQWKKAWFNIYLCYKYNTFKKPSHDIQYAFYWGRSFWDYKINFTGNAVLWTENKNQGDAFTMDLHGKRFLFFGDPQLWFNAGKGFSLGSKINMFYHVLTPENLFQIYPTAAIKYQW